jgi:hypothetical protein
MCSRGAAIRSWRATLGQTGKGFSIVLSMVAVVAVMALAGCDAPGPGDVGLENEGPAMAGEGGVADPNAELEVFEESIPDSPENSADTMSSKGHRRTPAASVPSDGVDWGDDRRDSDAETRLIEEQMRLRGRINTLDSQLEAFDINPPSRAARESDRRGRPEAIERRLDVERRTLEARDRGIRRELRQLRREPTPISPGTGSRESLFGGSGMQ